MAAIEYASTLFSILFRLSAYVFLRVIPARVFKFLLPGFYCAYALCYWLSPPAVSAPSEASAVAVKDANGVQEYTHDEKRAKAAKAQPRASWNPLALLLSLPSPIRRQRLLNLAVNTVLLNCAVDLLTAPLLDPAHDVAFTRVGAVYPDAAKLAVRYPLPNATAGAVQIVWRQTSDSLTETSAWKDGPVVPLTEANDWTTTVRLTGLWPSTAYEYRLADMNKYMLPVPAQPIAFRTFPDPRLPVGNHFRFIVTSCTTPNFPYRPFHGRAIKGYDLLAEYLWPAKPAEPYNAELDAIVQGLPDLPVDTQVPTEAKEADAPVPEPEADAVAEGGSVPAGGETNEAREADAAVPPADAAAAALNKTDLPPAEFMLFLGDFIYADVPIYFGDDLEAYRRLYRRNYNSPSFRKVYEKLPIFHVYDDHEIINNYAGLDVDAPPFPNASAAYTLYNSAANYDAPAAGEHYYDFRYGDVAFFVMDTRKHRSDVAAEDHALAGTMLGDAQLAALYEWLGKVNTTTTFKFIISSVPLTSLWTHDAEIDSWAGFPLERAALISALHTVPNVIVLSGDRHEAAVIEFNAADQTLHPVFEISTSPLSMFYVPFVRTLRSASDALVKRVRRRVVGMDEAGIEEIVEETTEIPQERVMKYVPIGNYKWSSIEVDTRDLNHPVARLELVADGRVEYNLEILGSPVTLKAPSAIGTLIPDNINKLTQILDKIGLKPSKWLTF